MQSYSVPATPLQGHHDFPSLSGAAAAQQQGGGPHHRPTQSQQIQGTLNFDNLSLSMPNTPASMVASPDPSQQQMQSYPAQPSPAITIPSPARPITGANAPLVQQQMSPGRRNNGATIAASSNPYAQQQGAYSMPSRPHVTFSPLPPSSLPPTASLLSATHPMPTSSSSLLDSSISSSHGGARSPVVQNLNDSFASVASHRPAEMLYSPAARLSLPIGSANPSPYSSHARSRSASASASNSNAGSIPPSPTQSLKDVISSQKADLVRAAECGEQLINDNETLQLANAALQSQVNDLLQQLYQARSGAATSSDSTSQSVQAFEELMRSEISHAAAAERSSAQGSSTGSLTQSSFTYTGSFSTDFSTFQNLLRTQRKQTMKLRTEMMTEIDTLKETLERQNKIIATSNHNYTALQAQHHDLESRYSDLEVQYKADISKSNSMAGQYQGTNRLLKEELIDMKKRAEKFEQEVKELNQAKSQLEKNAEWMKMRYAKLQEQAAQANLNTSGSISQLNSPSQPVGDTYSSRHPNESPRHRMNTIRAPPLESAKIQPAATATSLADDLATAGDEDSPSTGQQGRGRSISVEMPFGRSATIDEVGKLEDTDGAKGEGVSNGNGLLRSPSDSPLGNEQFSEPGLLSSTQCNRLSAHFDSIMQQETQRKEVRDSWHESEALWYIERSRARDSEQQACDIRRVAREVELAEMTRLSEGKDTARIIEHLKESLRLANEREEQLKQGQAQALTQSVAELTHALQERDDELLALRRKLKAKEQDATIPILSTPTLIASHEIAAAAAIKFTPHHARSTTANAAADPSFTFATPSASSSSSRAASPERHRPSSSSSTATPSSSSSSTSPSTQSLIPSSNPQDLKLLTRDVKEINALTSNVLREVVGSRRSTKLFLFGLMTFQSLFVALWMVLTSGGSTILSEHPYLMALLSLIDPDMNRFQS